MKVKPLYILIVIAALAVLLGVYWMGSSSASTVSAGDNISVYYTGSFTNGTVFDSNIGRTPLQFTAGSNQLIIGFSQGVIGMKLNETKTITLQPNEAYGYYNQSFVIPVPLSRFGNHTVSVGNIITQISGSGQQTEGIITALNNTTAIVDFNSPLSGKTLIFNVTVVKIQKKQ
jgi:peptidylprolyl isomerase